jgi:tetratricopeptide (TPR) repeat protein
MANTIRLPESELKLEHWQNPETNRSGYLRGLALDCFLNPDNDRNSHYFARDLMYSGRYRSAIQEFTRHIEMKRWPAEASQSWVYIGDCHAHLGNQALALRAYHIAFETESNRREPLIRLAEHYYKKKDAQRCAAFANAALTIGENGFYANHMAHYREFPHEMLYWAYYRLGNMSEAKIHWEKAIAYSPEKTSFLHDARFFMSLPKVSIVIPTLGREKQLEKCIELIKKNANYPDFEIIVEKDSFENRQGVCKTLKAGVEKARGEYIAFLGNDCEPQPNFLILAVLKALKCLNKYSYPEPGVGLVGFNDGFWKKGEIATHWLAHKDLSLHLEDDFFHLGYKHVGCDNELTERCRHIDRYVWCEEARIKHTAQDDDIHRLAWNPEDVAADRKLLRERSKRLGFKLTV